MRVWYVDASAIVKLVLDEPGSGEMYAWALAHADELMTSHYREPRRGGASTKGARWLRGTDYQHDDFDDLPDDVLAAFEGELD